MSEKQLRERKIRQEAINEEKARQRLNKRTSKHVESMRLGLGPNAPPREMLEKIATMLVGTEEAIRRRNNEAWEIRRKAPKSTVDPERKPKKKVSVEKFEEQLSYEFR